MNIYDTQKGAPAPAAIHLLFTQFPYDGVRKTSSQPEEVKEEEEE